MIKEKIQYRAEQILDWIGFLRFQLPQHTYIGGSCLIDHINDIDLFIPDGKVGKHSRVSYDWLKIDNEVKVVSHTKNAITLKWPYCPYPVQLCRHYGEPLDQFIDSFDFAHCQVGVRLQKNVDEKWYVNQTYYSQNFINSRVVQDSYYIRSDYPLSSLIRLNKYTKRGIISKHNAIKSTISILNNIIERGFSSYEDFKDQLDAVDLGLLPSELEQLDTSDLLQLFNLLRKDQEVKSV